MNDESPSHPLEGLLTPERAKLIRKGLNDATEAVNRIAESVRVLSIAGQDFLGAWIDEAEATGPVEEYEESLDIFLDIFSPSKQAKYVMQYGNAEEQSFVSNLDEYREKSAYELDRLASIYRAVRRREQTKRAVDSWNKSHHKKRTPGRDW